MTKEEAARLIDTLARDPELRARLSGILSQPPAPVDGRFEAILQEIRNLRADSNEMRADFNTRMESMRADFDTRMEDLASATRDLARGMKDLRHHVGVLGDRFGFTLEELAGDRLPRYLLSKEGWEVEPPVGREFVTGAGTVEIDLFAAARKEGAWR